MDRRSRNRSLFAFTAAAALAVSGCASGSEPGASTAEGVVQVVASTNVYGQIAEQIGGEYVDVVSIVTSAAQDPHSYEATAQDQLRVSRAELIIENGGGYDAFVDGLIAASGSTAPVITAVELSHSWPGTEEHDHDHDHDHADDEHADDDHDHAEEDHGTEDHADHDHADDHDHAGHGHIEGFNEHVWYDPHTMAHLAEIIADDLSAILPDHAETFRANLEAFEAEMTELENALADIAEAASGAEVFVTEPIAGYLVAAAGLVDVAPAALSQAVEEGQDVPPATLLQALELLRAGSVRVVVANAQTGGAETTEVIRTAQERDIPVLEFTEVLPTGETYFSWMQTNIADLATALES